MKLKRLEIQGFKSFSEKTVFKFQEDGLTGVVGPNGCGKSNIVDAVRWALGEQSAKLLRGQMMEDVIFNGSEKRKPAGMAEVVLLFENDGSLPDQWRDYAEIAVSRKLFRTGESEYSINGVSCRLKDVRELLADAGSSSRGYSIVEQGRISLLINSRPEEKRALIEEAAGVLKYRMRRQEAERKLERTRQNLLRVSDVIREVKRQVDSLKRSAAKARRYHRLRDEMNILVLRQRFEEYSLVTERLGKLEAELEEKRSGLGALEARLSGAEAREEELRTALSEGEDRITGAFEEVREVESSIARIEGDISARRATITSLEERLAVLLEDEKELLEKNRSDKSVVEQLELRLAAMDEDHRRHDQRVKEVQAGHVAAESDLESARNALEEGRATVFAMGTEKTRLDMLIQSSERSLEGAARRSGDAGARLSNLTDRLSRMKKDLAEGESDLQEATEAAERLAGEIDRHRDGIASGREDLAQIETAITAASEKQAELRGLQRTLASLEEELEGFSDGVRNVIKEFAAAPAAGVVGIVADHLEVPQRYERAVMAVLGERLGHVIVDEPENARCAIDFLKERSRGRGGFIPMKPRANGNGTGNGGLKSIRDDGVVGPLTDLITFSSRLNGVGEFLLGNTLLVEDLGRAVKLWKNNGFSATMVTPDGDVIEPTGVIIGGNNEGGEEGILARKRKLREVSAAVTSVEQDLKKLRLRRTETSDGLAGLENRLRELEEEFREAERRRMDRESRWSVLEGERKRLAEGLNDMKAESDMIGREESELRDILQEAKERMQTVVSEEKTAAGRLTELESEFNRRSVAMEKSRLDLEEARIMLSTARLQVENSRKELRDAEDRSQEARERGDRIRDEKEASSQRIAACSEEIADLERRLTELTGEMEARRDRLRDLRNAQESIRGEVEKVSDETRRLRLQVNEARDQGSHLDIQIHELRSEAQHVSGRVAEDHGRDITAINREEFDSGPYNRESATEEIGRLRQKISSMGEVNPAAAEEFDELNERYEFLTGQKADLEESMETLQKAIKKINRTSRDKFLNTFRDVSENFSRLFPQLFEGGSAEMTLIDENDPLNTGVEIQVKPPGKKLRSMQLLSGGEKALVSLTMILSLFLVKPSPFCILDEVDAPLDEDNLVNFTRIVRELSTRFQFLMITHNKQTMEAADVLYGITMREPGVSQVVSVKLKDVV